MDKEWAKEIQMGYDPKVTFIPAIQHEHPS
jgi:hypothetical protein